MTTLEEEEEGEKIEVIDEKKVNLEEKEMKLTSKTSSIVGLDSPKTIKFRGSINERNTVVLLDSGATHNFISRRLAKELQLSTTPVQFVITLGDKRNVRREGRSDNMKLRF